ncbi:hypothetical protein NXX78_24255 [Bacteroides fragilis]|nr:hypothetical protein [Bacteroides fragilis]
MNIINTYQKQKSYRLKNFHRRIDGYGSGFYLRSRVYQWRRWIQNIKMLSYFARVNYTFDGSVPI